MPTMASISVLKADETTSITYDALNGAGGDGSKAIWRQDAGANAALPLGMRAVFTAYTVWNGPKTARRAVFEYKRPYATLNSTTGRYESSDSVVGRTEIVTPIAIPAAEINEGVYQFLNLCGKTSGLPKQIAATGYAAQ